MAKPNIVAEAVKELKKSLSEAGEKVSSLDQDDLYGEFESIIDGLLYEDKYAFYGYDKDTADEDDIEDEPELLLEKLIFQAVRKCQKGGRRHTCDPLYDDAFSGFDCMSKMGSN